MTATAISVELEGDVLEGLDAIALARGVSRSELVQQACRSFIRQVGMVNPGGPNTAPPGQHAVHTNASAAALWEAAWLEEVIDPDDL